MEPVIIHDSIFFNGDCISGAAEHIPRNSVDLIITDPPYGINGDKLHQHYNRKEDFVVDGYVEIPLAEYGDFSIKWVKEAERILKPGGSIYIVSGYTNLFHILSALRQTELKEINHIIWKYNFGVFTSRKFVSSHYHILYYEKPGGQRTFNLESRYGLSEKLPDGSSYNYQDREDVWIINREYKPGQIKNKNELPFALLVKILQYSSNEGDLVCDLFLGGFSTAIAAIGLNRKAVGFEISKNIFDTKIEELQNIESGFLLRSLRKPVLVEVKNKNKSWSSEDILQLKKRFKELFESGTPKKDILKILEEELGRGRWSIEKALSRYDVQTQDMRVKSLIKETKRKESDLFQFFHE